ncbi:MAG: hypothetical protein ABSH52_20230 [Terriglobia bacterium]
MYRKIAAPDGTEFMLLVLTSKDLQGHPPVLGFFSSRGFHFTSATRIQIPSVSRFSDIQPYQTGNPWIQIVGLDAADSNSVAYPLLSTI